MLTLHKKVYVKIWSMIISVFYSWFCYLVPVEPLLENWWERVVQLSRNCTLTILLRSLITVSLKWVMWTSHVPEIRENLKKIHLHQSTLMSLIFFLKLWSNPSDEKSIKRPITSAAWKIFNFWASRQQSESCNTPPSLFFSFPVWSALLPWSGNKDMSTRLC